MPKLVVSGAVLQCSMGMSPSSLTVAPTGGVEGDAQPVATVMDFAPMMNVAPFGMCTSPANPQVAAATAAAMGTLTPQPCVPVIPSPWEPGASAADIGGLAALTEASKCMCQWAGVIAITAAGAMDFTVD